MSYLGVYDVHMGGDDGYLLTKAETTRGLAIAAEKRRARVSGAPSSCGLNEQGSENVTQSHGEYSFILL